MPHQVSQDSDKVRITVLNVTDVPDQLDKEAANTKTKRYKVYKSSDPAVVAFPLFRVLTNPQEA